MRTRAGLLVLGLVVVAGCGDAVSAGDDGPGASLDTAVGSDGAYPAALLSGTLEGQVSGDGLCTWVTGEDGVRTALLWPDGYTGRPSPLEILDEDGRVVARGGDEVDLGGGETADGTDRVERCAGMDTGWLVSPLD